MPDDVGPVTGFTMSPPIPTDESSAELPALKCTPTDPTGAKHQAEMFERPSLDFQMEKIEGKPHFDVHSTTLSHFVQHRFLPEYVETKRSASQAHFRSILKYLIPCAPRTRDLERCLESDDPGRGTDREWPYIGALPLHHIDEHTVISLISFVLGSGYSTQTATHIRNVIRAIFAHAINAHSYSGKNPAAQVELPRMVRKEIQVLTVPRVRQLIPAMRYPERPIALFALLTDMNVAEICGLQWQFVNISSHGALIEGEWLPPNNVAIRMQFYRGEHCAVTRGRRRSVPVPETLTSMLRELKARRRFTSPDDFVVASRIGTPVHPENIAARRLKALGREHDMPWLSWSAFRRLNRHLKSELGHQLDREVCSSQLSGVSRPARIRNGSSPTR